MQGQLASLSPRLKGPESFLIMRNRDPFCNVLNTMDRSECLANGLGGFPCAGFVGSMPQVGGMRPTSMMGRSIRL